MKNKFSKIGKLTLSLVVAFAVVAVSLFTAVPGINLGADAATVTDTWDGTTSKPTAADADGNIIINNAEELAWLASASTPDETKDKNYKVVDNAVFNLNGMTGITLDSGAGDVSAATPTGKNWINGGEVKNFAGNFDGNGVVIYNMYSSGAYGGLFSYIITDNTAKTCNFSNITVKASYIKGYHYAAGIVANSYTTTTSQYINFTNCKVENCYINSTDSNAACNRTGGLIIGHASHNKITVDDCIAINNVIFATNIKGGFIGNTSAHAGDSVIKNSVVIGSTPYAVQLDGSSKTLMDKSTKASCYSNIYTDQDVDSAYAGKVTKVAAANMKGAAAMESMPNLDWTKMIAFDGEYPDFRANHTLSVDAGDAAGHKIACSDCSKSMTEAHILVENATGSVKECSVCDYSETITDKKTVVWDGQTKPLTFAESGIEGGGTETNPYIIKTPAQLWYIAQVANADSAGKYFKVADNVGTFDMNNKGWALQDNNCNFQGTFDGNGVKIINFKASAWNAAVFPNVSGTVVIKKVKLSGASIAATGGNAGGIVANINGGATTNVTISNCVVENSTVESPNGAGALVGTAGNGPSLTIDNCLVKNNTVTTSYPKDDVAYKNNGILGLGWQSAKYTLSNSIVIGNDPTYWIGNFDNVYTDQETSVAQIKTLTADQMSGAAGLDNVALDFAGVWFANAGTPELQAFHNLKGAADTTDAYAGHTANCEDCGLEGVGLSDHAYDDAHTCTVCGFTCDHKNDNYVTDSKVSNGDCVTDPYVEKTCACGYSWTVTTGTASGHSLTKTAADGATCAKDGNVDYWTCSTCGKIFLSDDKMAAMDTAVEAEDVVVPATGAHVELRDDKGDLVYLMDETSHSTYCKVCQTKITTTAHEGEFEKDENGHSGKCAVCEYGTDENAPHSFGDDSACDICTWTCTDHIVKAGDVKVEGDCVTDKVTAQYCDRCKVSLQDDVVAATGHTLVGTDFKDATCEAEGNVDYWTCSTCEKIFLSEDKMAAMDTAVSAEDTVIVKLSHKYVGGKPVYKYDEVGHWFECEDCGKAEYTEHTLETDNDCEGVYQWCEDADGNSCGYEIFDYSYTSDDGSASVTASTNAFTKDVITDLIQITKESATYAEFEEIFKAAGHSTFTAYEFSPSEEMAEGGKATITVLVPDIYGNNAAIYYVDAETGKLEKLETKIETVKDEKENDILFASAVMTKTGVFAVAADEVVASNGDNDTDNNNGNANNNQTNNGSANNNGDTSSTSPATASETVAAVATVAALSAAAIVFARKVKKA